MRKMQMVPAKPPMMAGCDRCHKLFANGELYEATDAPREYSCGTCLSPEERKGLSLGIQVNTLASQLGYLEAAERNPDHTGIAATRDKLHEAQSKLRALWQEHCAPLIESGEYIAKGDVFVKVDPVKRGRGRPRGTVAKPGGV